MSLERIGHGGASALAPANTLASFDLAVQIGIDALEFDLRAWRGELVLAHTIADARRPVAVRLADALRHLSSRRFDGVGLTVDVKQVGLEAAMLDALGGAGLLDRALICSQLPLVLGRVRAREPRARVGISVGGRVARAVRRWGSWRREILVGLRDGRWDALMAQHKLIEGPLVEEVADRGGRVYAWTVNERAKIEELRRLGVHGIATADPRLFVG